MPESLDDPLVTRFLHQTLPKPEWTHEAHLRVGLWHLLHYPPPQALELLRDRIRSYNVSVGGENTDTSGYHETITRLYVELIAAFVADRAADRSLSFDALAEEMIQTLGRKDLPFQYYTKERLLSVEARRAWIEPDLVPLPAVSIPTASHRF